jgi:hypothetical protein
MTKFVPCIEPKLASTLKNMADGFIDLAELFFREAS